MASCLFPRIAERALFWISWRTKSTSEGVGFIYGGWVGKGVRDSDLYPEVHRSTIKL